MWMPKISNGLTHQSSLHYLSTWACEQKNKKPCFSPIYSHCIRGILFFSLRSIVELLLFISHKFTSSPVTIRELGFINFVLFISTLDCMMYATANCIIYLSEFIHANASNLKKQYCVFVFNKHCLQLRLKCVLYAWFSFIPTPQRPSTTGRFTFFSTQFSFMPESSSHRLPMHNRITITCETLFAFYFVIYIFFLHINVSLRNASS